jgi:acetyl esterase
MRFVPFSNSILLSRLATSFRFYKSIHKARLFKFKVNYKNFVSKCRLYVSSVQKAKPLIIFFHGGGFVYGGMNSADGALQDMCFGLDCNILAIKYALAPKFKFPFAVHQCTYIVGLITEQNSSFVKDFPICFNDIILMGDSAGGNIAIQVAIAFRQKSQNKKMQHQIVYLFLLYPLVELVDKCSCCKYPSIQTFEKGYLLTKKSLLKITKNYLPKGQTSACYASIVNCDLTHLPPSIIFACGFDPLFDQVVSLHKYLKQSDNVSSLVYYHNITHGYFAMFDQFIKRTIDCLQFIYEQFENIV